MSSDLSSDILKSPAFNETPVAKPGAAPIHPMTEYGTGWKKHRKAYSDPDYLKKMETYTAERDAWEAQRDAYKSDPRNQSLQASFRGTPDTVNKYLQGLKGMYDPLLGDFNKEISNVGSVESTREAMEKQQGLLAGRDAREAARYGTQVDPATMFFADRQRDLGNYSEAAGMLNTSRQTKAQIESAGRTNMINLGRGMTAEASAAAGIASSGQARMDAANDQADAARKQQQAQMAATMVMIALMA